MRTAALLVRLAVLASLVALAAGCGDYSHLSFRQDKRLHIVAPADRSTVTLPVTLRWSIRDFHVTGRTGSATSDSGYFALFVDRSPVPGGKSLAYVAHGDRSCQAKAGCPDRAYLAAHHVFATTAMSYTLTALPDPNLPHQKETHTVTIALLDGTGHRIGESAWSITFTLHRSSL